MKFKSLARHEFKSDEIEVNLKGRAGRVTFSGKKFHWEISARKISGRPAKRAGREVFDADRVGATIVLRHWRAGDRFQPIGMKAATKLQDLFVNAKIPAARRRDLVVATTADGTIFWVEGLRIGEAVKLTKETRKQLAWDF